MMMKKIKQTFGPLFFLNFSLFFFAELVEEGKLIKEEVSSNKKSATKYNIKVKRETA